MRGLKYPKASEALILKPPTDSAVALKSTQIYENLKLVEEQESPDFGLPSLGRLTSHVGYPGNVRVSVRVLLAPRWRFLTVILKMS